MTAKMQIEFTHEDEEGVEEVLKLPAKWVVCGDCEGKGKTYLGWTSSQQPAFSQEDFEQEGPDFREDYMSGAYDRDCPTCAGRTTVLVPDESREKDEKHKRAFELYRAKEKSEREYQAECAAERRAGA